MTPATSRDDLLRRASVHFAEHGIGDASLRAIATALGTSHRMLIYHFGSRGGLLAAVVDALRRDQQAMLDRLTVASQVKLFDAAWQFWTAMVDARAVGALLFELSAPAMHGAPWGDSFRQGSAALTSHLRVLLEDAGMAEVRAQLVAGMTMALVRGALWELAITGDRASVDRTVRTFLEENWPG